MDSRTDSSSINEGSNDNAPEPSLIDSLASEAFVQTFNYGVSHNGIEWQTWPGELSDPMAWSAQFLNPSQNLGFNSVPIPNAEIPLYTQFEGHI